MSSLVEIFQLMNDFDFGSQMNLPRSSFEPLVDSEIVISRHLFGGVAFLPFFATIVALKLHGVFSLKIFESHDS